MYLTLMLKLVEGLTAYFIFWVYFEFHHGDQYIFMLILNIISSSIHWLHFVLSTLTLINF